VVTLAVVWAALAGFVALAWWLDRSGRRPRPDGGYDAIVVAGCAVWPGGRPSPALSRRVARAVQLYRDGHSDRIVLTGGLGTHPPAEAVVAAQLCRQAGVPDEHLVIEDRSVDTEQNARFAARLVRGRVLVVTDPFHVLRCRYVFGRHFDAVDAVGAPGASLRSRARGASREVVSVLKHRLPPRALWPA
jgi:uncharacterized SAM-binding protein YcdF (DUF218 family)